MNNHELQKRLDLSIRVLEALPDTMEARSSIDALLLVAARIAITTGITSETLTKRLAATQLFAHIDPEAPHPPPELRSWDDEEASETRFAHDHPPTGATIAEGAGIILQCLHDHHMESGPAMVILSATLAAVVANAKAPIEEILNIVREFLDNTRSDAPTPEDWPEDKESGT